MVGKRMIKVGEVGGTRRMVTVRVLLQYCHDTSLPLSKARHAVTESLLTSTRMG